MEGRADKGEPTKILDEQPEIADQALVYWNAFQRLSGQRELGGMGAVGALRLEAVSHWLDESGIMDPVERERFRFYLEELDGEYLSLLSDRHKADADKATSRVRSR